MIPAIRRIHDGLAPETRGMIGIILAMMAFSLLDSAAKDLMERHSTVQVVWARYASQTLLLLVIFAPRLRSVGRTRHPRLQFARSVLLFTSTALFFTSLTYMEMAESVAVFEVAPLLITLLGALVLGEKVGPRRWAAVIAGLCGALIIIRPGLEVFQPAALLPLGAAVCMASFQIVTRMLGAGDSIWTTMLYSAGVGTIVASVAVPFFWTTPDLADGLLMLTFGWLGFAGHLCLVHALGQAPASTLAPFNYAGFVWALIFGYLFFGELPDGPTFVGAGIIVGAGIYVWHRERVHARRQHAAG